VVAAAQHAGGGTQHATPQLITAAAGTAISWDAAHQLTCPEAVGAAFPRRPATRRRSRVKASAAPPTNISTESTSGLPRWRVVSAPADQIVSV
jgi:hypothetical protein